MTKHGEGEAIRLLQDVESWQSRRDEKIDAWLVLCDAHLKLGYVDEAKRCLRRLDASPDMLPERRAQVITRLEALRSAAGSGSTVPATGSGTPLTGSAAPP